MLVKGQDVVVCLALLALAGRHEEAGPALQHQLVLGIHLAGLIPVYAAVDSCSHASRHCQECPVTHTTMPSLASPDRSTSCLCAMTVVQHMMWQGKGFQCTATAHFSNAVTAASEATAAAVPRHECIYRNHKHVVGMLTS